MAARRYEKEAERASIHKMLDLALDINKMFRSSLNPSATFCMSEGAGRVWVTLFADWHEGFNHVEQLTEVEMPITKWCGDYDPVKADEAIRKLEMIKEILREDKDVAKRIQSC